MHIEHISSVSTLLFYTAYTALNVNTNSDKKKKKYIEKAGYRVKTGATKWVRRKI